MKLDILAFGAHPDDVELGCAGTILKEISLGKTVGIIDLTRGELGTRGSAEIRDQEATAAAAILGVSARENLEMRDGFFVNDEKHQLEIIKMIRIQIGISSWREAGIRFDAHNEGHRTRVYFCPHLARVERVSHRLPVQEELRPWNRRHGLLRRKGDLGGADRAPGGGQHQRRRLPAGGAGPDGAGAASARVDWA